MPSDRELDEAAAQLAQFRFKHSEHHKNHEDILEKYGTLLKEFKRLQSDFDEARDSRERYKQMAKGSERNPFVLVLIDGDGYVFDDDLLESGAEGGSRAAQLLSDAVRNSLRARGLDHCRIMVRIYANLAGLSKAVSKSGLAGPEKRSLAPFFANFNRSNDLFDFVDAGELKENADFKIRAVFRQFIENAQCRHVFFAACHDVGYISELVPYAGQREQITLLRNFAFHKEFSKLGLRTEDFPNIFRTKPLQGFSFAEPAAPKPVASPPKANHVSTPSADSGIPCTFFPKGQCKYGKGCKFLHIKASNGNAQPSLADIRDWRKDSTTSSSKAPFQMPQLSKSDNDFMTGYAQQPQLDFTLLPREESIPPNTIPLNSKEQRLDPYQPPTSADDRASFNGRVAKQKLCNNHHLNGYCPNGIKCQYDHSTISEGMRNCLRQVSHNNPCPRRNGCRSLTCLYGHLCQKDDCKHRGGKIYCKFPHPLHITELNAVDFVPGSNAIVEENNAESLKGDSASHSSDDESFQRQEGASLNVDLLSLD